MSIAGSAANKDCVCVWFFAVTCSVGYRSSMNTESRQSVPLSCHSQTKIGKLLRRRYGALEYSGRIPICSEENVWDKTVSSPHSMHHHSLTCDSRSPDRYHISRRRIADATETALRELELPHPPQRPPQAPGKKELCTSPDWPSGQWRTAPGEVTN